MSTDQEKAAAVATKDLAAEKLDETVDPELSLLIDANLADSLGEYLRAWVKKVRGGDTGLLPVVAGLILIVIVFQTQKSTFLSVDNFVNLIGQASYFVVFGMAEVFVLLLGEIDLSAGYVSLCGGAITTILVGQQHNVPWWLAALAGLVFCVVCGAVIGLLVTRLRLPSFVVTLAGLLAFEGGLLFIFNTWAGGQGGSVRLPNTGVLYDLVNGRVSPTAGWVIIIALIAVFAAFTLGRDRRRRANGLVAPPIGLSLAKIAGVGIAGVVLVAVCNVSESTLGALGTPVQGVPWSVFIILAIAFAETFLLGRTRFGRYVYAVGGNAEAARRAGINLNRIRLLCFVLCSLTAGLAGLFYVSNIQESTTSVDGGQLVLFAVAAAVIGGTSLFGGRGKIVHAVIGGLVIATIYNGMALLGLNTDAQDIVTALVLVAAATVDSLARRGAAKA
jgi:D-xylose transport system permease protein